MSAPLGRLSEYSTDLYLVTDTAMAESVGCTVADTVAQAIAGGVGIVQVRDKHIDDAGFEKLTVSVLDAVQQAREEHGIDTEIPVFVNDRVDVAARLLEQGRKVHVHVGQGDMSADDVRQRIGAEPLLGVSAQEPEHFERARSQAVDLLGIGPVYATQTKETGRSAISPEGFQERAEMAGLPAFAIGGIKDHNAAALRGTGAAGICVVSAIMTAPDPAAAARSILQAYTGENS